MAHCALGHASQTHVLINSLSIKGQIDIMNNSRKYMQGLSGVLALLGLIFLVAGNYGLAILDFVIALIIFLLSIKKANI